MKIEMAAVRQRKKKGRVTKSDIEVTMGLLRRLDDYGLNEVMVAASLLDPRDNLKFVLSGLDFRAKAVDTMSSVMHFAATNKRWSLELVAMYSLLGLDPFEPDASGTTPIDCAIYTGKLETAEQLLKMHNAGCNLLHYCIVRNMTLYYEKVLDYKYNKLVRQYDFQGRNAFHVAAQFADEKSLLALINEVKRRESEEGARDYFNSVCRDRGCSAFHYAVLNKKHAREIVYQLYDLNLNEDLKNWKGYTPFHLAMITENLEAAEGLIDCCVLMNEKVRGKSIMAVCVLLNKFNSVKYLHVKRKKKIRRVRVKGLNALQHAVQSADLASCKWLIETAGFNAHQLCPETFRNNLHFAARNATHGAAIVKYLASLGLRVNKKDKIQITPLHLAISSDNAAVAQALIELKADLQTKRSGENYLHFCVRMGALECAKIVHKHRENLIKGRTLIDGKSVLHIAAGQGCVKMVCWLIEAGADFFARTPDGLNAEDFIPENDLDMTSCFLEIVQGLLKKFSPQ